MQPVIDGYLERGVEPGGIAAMLSGDKTLSEPLRRAGLDLLLKRCSEIRERALPETGREGS